MRTFIDNTKLEEIVRLLSFKELEYGKAYIDTCGQVTAKVNTDDGDRALFLNKPKDEPYTDYYDVYEITYPNDEEYKLYAENITIVVS